MAAVEESFQALAAQLDAAAANEKKLSKLESQLAEVQKQLADASGQAISVAKQAEAYQQELAKLSGHCKTQEEALSEWQTKHQSLNKLAVEQRERLQRQIKRGDVLKSTNDELQQRVKQLTKTTSDQAKQVSEQRSQLKQVNIAKDEQAKLAAERQKQVEQLTKDKNAQMKLAAEHQQQLETLKKSVSDETKRADQSAANLKEMEQENELLLLQLHQVQEELEQVFLKHKDAEAKIQAETKAKAEQTKLAAERQEQIDQANKANNEQAKLVSELTQQQADLQQQLKTLSQQKEQQAALVKEQQKEAEVLGSDNKKEITQLKDNVKELEQENELLLLQLHHVQEELEHYFLKYQELEGQPAAGGISVQQLTLQGSFEQDEYYELKWLAHRVKQVGRTLETVHFKLASHGGVPALELRPENSDEQTALVWPELMRDEYGDRLLVKPDDGQDDVFRQALLLLSPADWQLVNGLLDRVVAELMQSSVNLPDASVTLARAQWLKLAAKLKQSLRVMPSVLRIGKVDVREVYHAEGYEHFWLTYNDLSYEGYQYERYSFKLVLKDMQEDSRPATVALVFRDLDDGLAPLGVWPPETSDEFGPVLSVEFDAASGVAKAGWDTLWRGDQQFLAQLIAMLPATVEQVAQSGADFGERAVDEIAGLLESVDQALQKVGEGVPEAVVAADDGESDEFAEPEAERGDLTEAALEWEAVSLSENYRAGRYAHLGLRVKNLRFAGQHWPDYDFKLFARKLGDDLAESWAGLEFRAVGEGNMPLLHWPPSHVQQDDFGDYVIAEKDYRDKGFHEADQLLIGQILESLPAWLKVLDAEGQVSDPEWNIWQSLLAPLCETNLSSDT